MEADHELNGGSWVHACLHRIEADRTRAPFVVGTAVGTAVGMEDTFLCSLLRKNQNSPRMVRILHNRGNCSQLLQR